MGFSVDPHRMRADGHLVERIRAGAQHDLGRIHGDTVAGGPAVRGTDAAVAAAYDELTTITGQVLDLVGAVLDESGTGTLHMADAYERADTTARHGFHSP